MTRSPSPHPNRRASSAPFLAHSQLRSSASRSYPRRSYALHTHRHSADARSALFIPDGAFSAHIARPPSSRASSCNLPSPSACLVTPLSPSGRQATVLPPAHGRRAAFGSGPAPVQRVHARTKPRLQQACHPLRALSYSWPSSLHAVRPAGQAGFGSTLAVGTELA